MQIENIEALRVWLPTFIEPMSDADPNALAKYVLALMKKDRPEEELKELCADQLEVFFKDSTKKFVDNLFEAIHNKSYLNEPEIPNQIKPEVELISEVKNEVMNPVLPLTNTAKHQPLKSEKMVGLEKDMQKRPPQDRAHSRSRSPVNNKSRDHEDRRNRKYSDDDKKRRRNVAPGRRFDFKFRDRGRQSNDEKVRGRDRGHMNRNRESRSRSKSWNRSRSRSKSWSGKSRSPRSWSRSPDRNNSRTENGQSSYSAVPSTGDSNDKDYRVNSHHPQSNETKENSLHSKNIKFKVNSKRCRDFDESYIPEPYNPEAPGMERPAQRLNQPPKYWVPQSITSMPPPPMGMIPTQMPPPHLHMVAPQVFLAPPPPIPRTRELIGVPTVEYTHSQNTPGIIRPPMDGEPRGEQAIGGSLVQSAAKPLMTTHVSIGRNFRRHPYNNNFKKMHQNRPPSDKCTLELRRIPPQQNTIALLNDHFTKFGTIVNLQVNYDGDQEAALIQFSSNAEATSAYKCTEAVFNNRFIKLFWHNKENAPKPVDQGQSNMKDNGFSKNGTQSAIEDGSNNANNTEKTAVFTPLSGNLSRTLINKTALNNTQAKLKELPKKETIQKQMTDFQVKRTDMLNKHINDQKILLDKLSKCKSEKEKSEIRMMMATVDMSIENIKKEMKQAVEGMTKLVNKPTQATSNKTEMQKQLLDAELDLYNKQHSGDDTTSLMRKVNFLKQQATRMGLVHPKGRGAAARGAMSYRGRGRGAITRGGLTNLDRRPRKLIVKGEEAILTKIKSCFPPEKSESVEDGTIISFKTFFEAEKAKTLISNQLNGQQVSIQLYFDNPYSLNKDPMMELNPNEIIMNEDDDASELELSDVFGDEEEEEDDIGRSWRR